MHTRQRSEFERLLDNLELVPTRTTIKNFFHVNRALKSHAKRLFNGQKNTYQLQAMVRNRCPGYMDIPLKGRFSLMELSRYPICIVSTLNKEPLLFQCTTVKPQQHPTTISMINTWAWRRGYIRDRKDYKHQILNRSAFYNYLLTSDVGTVLVHNEGTIRFLRSSFPNLPIGVLHVSDALLNSYDAFLLHEAARNNSIYSTHPALSIFDFHLYHSFDGTQETQTEHLRSLLLFCLGYTSFMDHNMNPRLRF